MLTAANKGSGRAGASSRVEMVTGCVKQWALFKDTFVSILAFTLLLNYSSFIREKQVCLDFV